MLIREMEMWVNGWIEKERPQVRRWNVDENAERSIDSFHVHVYLQVVEDEEVDWERRRSSRSGSNIKRRDEDENQEPATKRVRGEEKAMEEDDVPEDKA